LKQRFLDHSRPSAGFSHPSNLGKTARLVDIGEDAQLNATLRFELSSDDKCAG